MARDGPGAAEGAEPVFHPGGEGETMAQVRPARSALIVIALAVALAGCGKGGNGDKPPERGDAPAAKVNGKTVWVSDVRREAVAQGLVGAGEPLDTSSDVFQRMLGE